MDLWEGGLEMQEQITRGGVTFRVSVTYRWRVIKGAICCHLQLQDRIH